MADDLQRLLEADIEARRKKGGLTAEEVVEMQSLWEKIKQIDLEKAVEERVAKMTPIEQLVERLATNKEVKKALFSKGKKTKQHHKTRKAKVRKRKKVYWVEVAKPYRKAKLAEQLKTPEGWWKHLNTSWKKRKVPVKLSYGEFVEYVYNPIIRDKGRLPIFQRLDPAKPVALGNLRIVDSMTRDTLFDGNEHVLRLGGYIL